MQNFDNLVGFDDANNAMICGPDGCSIEAHRKQENNKQPKAAK